MKQLIKLFFLLAFVVVSAYAVPVQPPAPDLEASSDTGVFDTDNITKNTTLTFTGSKDSNETITLYLNGITTDLNDNSTNTYYSITATNTIDGSYLYSVVANDGSGDSIASGDLNVSIDTTPPIAGTVTDNNVTLDNVVNLIESQNNITLSGTANGGDIQMGDDVNISVNGNIYTTSVLIDGSWSVLVSSSDLAADSSIQVDVVTNDVAGNSVTSSNIHNYSVDLVFTSGTLTINDITADNTINYNEYLGNIDVNGTAIGGDISVGDTVYTTVNGSNYSTVVNADFTWSISIPGSNLINNSDAITVYIDSSDSAGNTGTSSLNKTFSQDLNLVATVTIDNITSDNVINFFESEGNVTVSGLTSGEIYFDDNVSVNVNGVDYNTTVTADLNWSVSVLGSDLVADTYIVASVISTDLAGNTGTTNSTNAFDTHSVDLNSSVSIDSITQVSNGFELSYDIIGSTDIESGRDISFSIDGVIYTTQSNGFNFGLIISNQNLNLIDGNQYTVSLDTNLTDAAGNIASVTDMNFTYDNSGNVKEKAKNIKLSDGDVSAYLNSSDVDYYMFDMAQKGLLSLDINSSNINIELYQIDDTLINEVNATSVLQVLDKGSYLIKISGTYVGSYTLSSSTEFYEEEIDPSVVVNSSFITTVLPDSYTSDLYVHGGLLYTNSGSVYNLLNDTQDFSYAFLSVNKFFIKDGNYVYADGGDIVIQSHLNYLNSKRFTFGSSSSYIASLGDTAYVLEGDSVHLIDISSPDSMSITQTITLPAIDYSYSKITIYQGGVNTYLYALDSSQSLYVYNINTATPVLESQIDYIPNAYNITIDNGLLYTASDSGVYIFDINTQASKPKLIKKLSVAATAVAATNNMLYVSNGVNVDSYDIGLDYEDNVSSELSLNRLALNTTTNINKYSGKNDVDIFRIDLVNSGDLNLTTSDVNSTNLTLSVSLDSNFSTTLAGANNVDFINQSIVLSNLEAKTYYIKIDTNDSMSFDNYTLENTFTKVTSDDSIDALLNIALSSSTSVSVDENITSGLDNNGNDIDLYRIELSSDGNLSIDNPEGKTIGIYTADVDNNSSYASLTQITTVLSAGTYYIRVSGADGNYTIVPRFASYADGNDEYVSISIDNVIAGSIDGNILELDIRDGFIKTGTTLLNSFVSEYAATQSKTYISQASDGKYIYGLYRYNNTVDSSIEIGIDIFEYINETNIYHVATKVLPENSDAFDYNIKIVGDELIFRQEYGWIKYDISNPLSIPDSTTVYIGTEYLDFEVNGSRIYAVDGVKLDVLDSTIRSLLLTTDVADSTSVTMYDDLVYVSTSTQGIKVFKSSDLSLVKEIQNIQNVTYLQSYKNKLYLLDDTLTFKTMDIEKDYSDDFANANLIFLDNNINGAISSSNDQDYFKVNLDFTGDLNTSLSGTSTCALYDSSLTSIGACTQTVPSGTYYLELSNTSASAYILNASLSPISSDMQDTLRFYSGDTTNLTVSSSEFNASIDAANDIDYFKVTLDTTGLLDLNVTNSKDISLVYENGSAVEKINGKYNIVVSGEYFIKVTSATTGIYTVSASFESIIDDKYVDTPINVLNESISSLNLRGESPKVISSGDIVYWVDELDGLSVIDVSDVSNPIITSRVSLEGTPKKLFLDGSVLYVALGNAGFAVIDVSNSSGANLYAQINVSDSVNSLVAKERTLFIASTNSIKKFDLSQPISPVELDSISATDATDMEIHLDKLLIAQSTGVQGIEQSDFTNIGTTGTIYDASSSKIVRDSNYIFILDSTNSINIFDTNLTDTGLNITLSDTGSIVEDMYVNNKILYVSKNTGYDIVEYKDISNISVTPASGALKSITLAQNSLMLAKVKKLEIVEATPDYPDSLRNQYINQIDLSGTESTTGIFAVNNDIDVFKYTNVNFTGSLNINMTSDQDINVSIYNSNFELLDSAINNLSSTINSGVIYLEIKPAYGVKSSYEFSHTFVTDGTLDVLDLSLTYDTVSMDTPIEDNLYIDGHDKDYYKLIVDERGNYSFNTDNPNVKVSLLYPSATTIASNYDENNQSIKLNFDADLAAGEYYILVENEDVSRTSSESYKIDTSFGETGEIALDSGVGYEPFSSIAAYSHTDRFSYMLKDGTLHRMSNILESRHQVYNDNLSDTDSVYKMFTYNEDSEDAIFISRVSNIDNNLNIIALYLYDVQNGEYNHHGNLNISSITNEDIMLIDQQSYIYYYDGDSLYISNINDIDTAELLAFEKLSIVKVSGNYMYAVTPDFIQVYDISDKTNIDASKLLETIYTENVKSIYIDSASNRLFVGANDKIEIWNISDKESSTKISEFNIGFNENDLYYKGTPTSMYMFDSKLYAAVSGVGLIFFDLDEFNVLSIEDTVLNLGENLTEIYTFRGTAINYIISDELKVYFRDSTILDADSLGTYNIVGQDSVSEGSKTFEGCFIATAAYGSYFDPNVKILRDFRDDYLMHSEVGRAFVDIYYTISPSIAMMIVDDEFTKSIIRILLMPIVYFIQYPLLLVLLLISMFFVAFKNRKVKSINSVRKI